MSRFDNDIAGSKKFDKNKHRRGFAGKFVRMGLSARKLKENHGVDIKGLGTAKPRYKVATTSGSELGHVVRSNDGAGKEIYHIETPHGRHPDGPFPTRAMAGAAIADMHGKLDADGDGKISADERSAGLKAKSDAVKQGQDRNMIGKGKPSPGLSQLDDDELARAIVLAVANSREAGRNPASDAQLKRLRAEQDRRAGGKPAAKGEAAHSREDRIQDLMMDGATRAQAEAQVGKPAAAKGGATGEPKLKKIALTEHAPDDLTPNKQGSRFKAGLPIRAYGKYDGKHLGFDAEGNHWIEMTMGDGSKQVRNVGKVDTAGGTKPITVKAGAKADNPMAGRKGQGLKDDANSAGREQRANRAQERLRALTDEELARSAANPHAKLAQAELARRKAAGAGKGKLAFNEKDMAELERLKAVGVPEATAMKRIRDRKVQQAGGEGNRNVEKAAQAAKAQEGEMAVAGIKVSPDTPPYIVEELKRGKPFPVTGPLKAAGVERVTVDNQQDPRDEDPDYGIYVYVLMKDGTVHAEQFKNRWHVTEEAIRNIARNGGEHKWGAK